MFYLLFICRLAFFILIWTCVIWSISFLFQCFRHGYCVRCKCNCCFNNGVYNLFLHKNNSSKNLRLHTTGYVSDFSKAFLFLFLCYWDYCDYYVLFFLWETIDKNQISEFDMLSEILSKLFYVISKPASYYFFFFLCF